MHLATCLKEIRLLCAPRIHKRQSKQLYDWTTHAVNHTNKEINSNLGREQQFKCSLCDIYEQENQVYTSITYQHLKLVTIPNLYKKEIDVILLTFNQCKYKRNKEWIRQIMNYVTRHQKSNTSISADIWNERWSLDTCGMMYEIVV